MFPTPIEKTSVPTRLLYRVGLPLSLLIWLLPLIAVLLTAVRGIGDITSGNQFGWPSDWMFFDNVKFIFDNTPMLTYIRNSFLIAIPTVIGAVGLACMSGFALGIYRFKLNIPIFFLFVGGNFVPFQILMVPVRDMSVHLGLYDSITGLVLFHIAFQSGFCTFFMRNFIRDLPRELIEAARVEGASEFTIFFKVVLPLVRPALAALAVLIFTFIWNEYFWATVLIQGDHAKPVVVGIKSLNGQFVSQFHLISVGSILAALPPVLIFFAMQKHFIAGLAAGGGKEG
jgi:multiple sugar transport system permease protein